MNDHQGLASEDRRNEFFDWVNGHVRLITMLLVTRSRTGEERQLLLDLSGIPTEEYDPHARETAVHLHDVNS